MSSSILLDKTAIAKCNENLRIEDDGDDDDEDDDEDRDDEDDDYREGKKGQRRANITCKSLQEYAKSRREEDHCEIKIDDYISYIMRQVSQVW